MKRDRALIVFLGIFLILIVNPLACSIPAARGNEIQEVMFSTAADGAESSDSITSFSETSADDVGMLYPDSTNDLDEYINTTYPYQDDCADDTIWPASGYEPFDYFADDGSLIYCNYTTSGTRYAESQCNDPHVTAANEGTFLIVRFKWATNESTGRVAISMEDLGGSGCGTINSLGESQGVWLELNDTIDWDDDADDGVSSLSIGMTGNIDGVHIEAWIEYIAVTDTTLYDTVSSGYTESFSSVSDWTTSDTSISTDDDVATITENGASSTGRAYASFSSTDYQNYYYETRVAVDTSANYALEFYSGSTWHTLVNFSAADTYRGIISDSNAATMTRIGFWVSGEGKYLKPDYLRIQRSNESGWAHDGSTTAGVTHTTSGNMEFTESTDGDVLTMNATMTNSYSYTYRYYLHYDTTATACDLDRDYYPFGELRYRVTQFTGLANMQFTTSMGGYYAIIYLDTDGSWHTLQWNQKAAGSSGSTKALTFSAAFDSVGDAFVVEIDWAQYCSIANYTVTQSGAGIYDCLYVSSGALISTVDSGYIELNHDPALTVNTATYNIFNTTSGSTAPQTAYYVGSWSSYTTETRGELSSGTLTDLKLKFTAAGDCAAIKFIEDSTAPTVVRSSSTPNDPEDDETVTLSAVITDAVEVWSVAFNAIVYPTGFSDVDYDATEQADNLWTYEFSSLITGYYCFKIIASDGANTNPLTEYAYIELTVREAAIMVEEITLIGAGEDFSMMTFSARINRDCSYTIYEESASSPESDTHTGSVSSPSFNLAWTKLDVDDINVNFTIKFTSGSLTYNYTSQYQVAQNTFYISIVMQVDGLDTVTVLGRISKLGNYLLYDENNELKDSGSVTDLDFTIRFNKWSGYDEQDHDFAIKFTNGTQTCWYNSSYYAFKKPVAAGVVTTDKNALYAFQASFWTGVMIFFVGLMVAIDLYRRYLKN